MSALENCWSHCLATLEERLGADQFRIWIRPLVAEANGDALSLIVPNQIFLQFIRDRYMGLIEEPATTFFNGEPPSIELKVG
ncbi:DnaA N-terminal domain-containing protein, partial [Chitiniphilus shinanonensis]|uniref:DnaA N-terminal domain-containing protein n=1 Tax=Chitiniphilus shinanonensis TaxID=553088 RepID=UPI003341D8B2